MCTCDKPTINGEFGYKWNHPCAGASIYPVNPPKIENSDEIIFDEAGRCGGIDSHSYHYRLIKSHLDGISLLVRHGGGDEKISFLSNSKMLVNVLKSLDSNGRYWILNAIYRAQLSASSKARKEEEEIWRTALAEKRVKTRKIRNQEAIKIWIVPEINKFIEEGGEK